MTASQKTSNTRTGIIAILISVLALSLGDAVIKSTGTSLALWQMYILRSFVVLPVLFVFRWSNPRGITFHSWFWVVVRSALLVVMWLCYYSALNYMPLSLAAAAYYTGPLFITILVAVQARRFPKTRTWIAIGSGFFGVLLILRPQTTDFQAATLLPVLAAFLYAVAMIITSSKCSSDDPVSLVIALNVAFIVCGLLVGFWSADSGGFINGPWVPVDASIAGVVLLLAVVIICGGVGAAIAYQNGPPVIIAAFDYSYLIFSLLWGLLFFAEYPGWVSIAGIAAIVLSGLLALTEPSP